RAGAHHTSAPIVTKTAPRGQYLAFCRRGQRMNVRKSLEEKPIVFEHGSDARLLQHYFGNPNTVWVAGFAPRQIASIFVVPAQKHTAKTSACRRLNDCFRGNFFHSKNGIVRSAPLVFNIRRSPITLVT